MKFIESLPLNDIDRFCRSWQIRELAFFGSILRDDFDPASDVDVMVTFRNQGEWGLLDHVRMHQELQTILGRRVDLITRNAVEQTRNQILREEILNTTKVIYSEFESAYAKR